MLVQDPLSGYLHEVPDVPPHYGDYGGAYYSGYDGYVDPSVTGYPGELGHLGFLPIPQIFRAIFGRRGSQPPPPPPPVMIQPTGAGFVPSPGMRAYIAAVVRDVLAQTGPGANPMLSQGGFRRRRSRRR